MYFTKDYLDALSESIRAGLSKYGLEDAHVTVREANWNEKKENKKVAGLESYVDQLIYEADPSLRKAYVWKKGMVIKDKSVIDRLLEIINASDNFGDAYYLPVVNKIVFGKEEGLKEEWGIVGSISKEQPQVIASVSFDGLTKTYSLSTIPPTIKDIPERIELDAKGEKFLGIQEYTMKVADLETDLPQFFTIKTTSPERAKRIVAEKLFDKRPVVVIDNKRWFKHQANLVESYIELANMQEIKKVASYTHRINFETDEDARAFHDLMLQIIDSPEKLVTGEISDSEILVDLTGYDIEDIDRMKNYAEECDGIVEEIDNSISASLSKTAGFTNNGTKIPSLKKETEIYIPQPTFRFADAIRNNSDFENILEDIVTKKEVDDEVESQETESKLNQVEARLESILSDTGIDNVRVKIVEADWNEYETDSSIWLTSSTHSGWEANVYTNSDGTGGVALFKDGSPSNVHTYPTFAEALEDLLRTGYVKNEPNESNFDHYDCYKENSLKATTALITEDKTINIKIKASFDNNILQDISFNNKVVMSSLNIKTYEVTFDDTHKYQIASANPENAVFQVLSQLYNEKYYEKEPIVYDGKRVTEYNIKQIARQMTNDGICAELTTESAIDSAIRASEEKLGSPWVVEDGKLINKYEVEEE